MATITRGQTFGVTEQVTNTKLHNLVDNAIIANVVNLDISDSAAIEDLKLDTITRSNKVSGTSMFNLASIPSGAGEIPSVNLALDLSEPGEIGGTTPAAITGTVVEAGTSLAITGTGDDSVVVTGVKDEDDMVSDSATHLPTQQSVKAYVDTEVGGISSGGWEYIQSGTLSSVTSFTVTESFSDDYQYKLVVNAAEDGGYGAGGLIELDFGGSTHVFWGYKTIDGDTVNSSSSLTPYLGSGSAGYGGWFSLDFNIMVKSGRVSSQRGFFFGSTNFMSANSAEGGKVDFTGKVTDVPSSIIIKFNDANYDMTGKWTLMRQNIV